MQTEYYDGRTEEKRGELLELLDLAKEKLEDPAVKSVKITKEKPTLTIPKKRGK